LKEYFVDTFPNISCEYVANDFEGFLCEIHLREHFRARGGPIVLILELLRKDIYLMPMIPVKILGQNFTPFILTAYSAEDYQASSTPFDQLTCSSHFPPLF
jgi:hypothetical protein